MTEFLEKVKSQELVVTPAPEESSAEATKLDGQSEQEPQSSKVNNSKAADENQKSEQSKDSNQNSDSQTPAGKNSDSNHFEEQTVASNSANYDDAVSHGPLSLSSLTEASTGLKRHRAIQAGCIALSLAILSLALVDLSGLIEKKGRLDSKLQFTSDDSKNKLPLSYAYLDNPSSEGLRPIRSSNWSDNFLGYADDSGKVVLPLVYAEVTDFHDGVAAVKFRGEKQKDGSYPSKDTQKWGYIDKTGKVILPPTYKVAGQFQNGVASVEFKNFGALIDKHGKFIRSTINGAHAPELVGDLWVFKGPGGLSGLVNAAGNYVVPPMYDRIELTTIQGPQTSEHYTVWNDGKCGLIDKTGKLVMPVKFENIVSYNRGHAVAMVNGSYGLTDSSGKFVIEPKYKLVTMYDDVIATMDFQDHWTLFDSKGNQLPTVIDGAIAQNGHPWLYDGMGAIILGDKCGFADNTGAISIPATYDYTQHFSGGFGLGQKDGYWSYIDKHGKKVLATTFPDAKPLSDGKANVTVGGLLYPFINGRDLESSHSQASSTITKFKNGEGVL